MRKTFRQSALALMLLGGAVLATAPAFAGYRHIYVGPPAVVAPPVAVAPPVTVAPPVAIAPPVVAVEPYAPEVIVQPVVPVAPPVVGYASPVPVAPEADFDYGPPAGPGIEVGGY
jgi:hypothetical protein